MAVFSGVQNATAPRAPGLTEMLADHLAETTGRLIDRVQELENLADRIFGPLPSDPKQPEKVERTAVCVADMLQDRARALQGVADRLVSATNRLNQLV